MSRFVQGDRTSFGFCSNLGFLFQPTDDTVYCIQEVLFANEFLSVTGSDQCRFVADIGNVGAGESRSLASQQVYIYRVIYLDRAQVYAKYFFTFIQVGQIYVYLAVETPCTEQGLDRKSTRLNSSHSV